MTVGEYLIQKDQIASAEETLILAESMYTKTIQRFALGREDLNSLTLSRQRQEQARRNYVSALENYWISYYKLRKLTLYDFEYNMPITKLIELTINN